MHYVSGVGSTPVSILTSRYATVSLYGKTVEVTVWSRRLNHEELHYLSASPNTVREIKLRKMGWAGHVARIEEMRYAYNILVGKPEGKTPLEELSVDGKIILELALEK
jgi:hypothetical protein